MFSTCVVTGRSDCEERRMKTDYRTMYCIGTCGNLKPREQEQKAEEITAVLHSILNMHLSVIVHPHVLRCTHAVLAHSFVNYAVLNLFTSSFVIHYFVN